MLATALLTAGSVQASGEAPSEPTDSKNLSSKTNKDCYSPDYRTAYPFAPALDQQQIQEWMSAQQDAMQAQRKAQLEAMEAHRQAQLEAMQTQQQAMNDYMEQLNQTYRTSQETQTNTVADYDYGLYPAATLPAERMNARWQAYDARRQARNEARRVKWEELSERRQQRLAEFDATRDAFEQRRWSYMQYPFVAANDNTTTTEN
jgi:hypothetical protein